MSIEDALGGMFARTGIDDGLTVSPQTITDRLLRKALSPSDVLSPSRSATALSPTPAITAAPLPRERPASAPPRTPAIDFGSDDEIVPAAAAPAPSLDFGADDQIVTGQGGIGSDAARVPGQLDPMPPVQPLEDVKPPEPEKPWAFTRGFVSGMMKENPEVTGEALEGFSHLTDNPDFKEALKTAGRDIAGVAKLSPEAYAKKSKSMWDIKNIDEALTYAGETMGSGIASSVPSLALGVGGAVFGGRVGGKLGATVGGSLGAMGPGFTMNYGEVYKALKDEKVDPRYAAEVSLPAAAVMAGLDFASLGPIISRLGGMHEAKREIARNLARRIAQETAKGSGREAVPEALQEMVKDAALTWAASKPFFTTENAKGWLESLVGGALTGGAMGGAAGIRRDQVTPAQPERSSPEDINEFLRTARETAPQAPAPGPGLPAPPPTPAGEPSIENPVKTPTGNQTASPADDAILRAYGYSPEQIAGMSPREREAEIADAKAAGVEPAPEPEKEIGPLNQAPKSDRTDFPAPLEGEVLPPLKADSAKALGTTSPYDYGNDDPIVNSGQIIPEQQNADTRISSVAERERSLSQSEKPIIQKLRWPGNRNVPALAGQLPDVSEGDRQAPITEAYDGENRKQQRLLSGQLALGDPRGTGAQSTDEQIADAQGRDTAVVGVGGSGRASAIDVASETRGRNDAVGSDRNTEARGTAAFGQAEPPLALGAPNGRAARGLPPPDKLTPLQFLASKGGIQPEPDVRALGFNSRNRVVVPGTGFRPVLRSSGMTSEAALQALVEGGYLPQGASVADAHALMRGEIDNQSQPQADAAPIALPAPAAVEQAYADAGVTPAEIEQIKSLGIVEAAAELVEQGMPVEQAIPQATAAAAIDGHLTPEQAQEVFDAGNTAKSDEGVVAGESTVNEDRAARSREDFGQGDERVESPPQGNEPAPRAAESEGRAEGLEAIQAAGVWWKDDLSNFGREMAVKAAGLKESRAKVLWRNLRADEQEKLSAIRGTDADPVMDRDAPTWAEVLAALPKDGKGRADMTVAADLMFRISRKKQPSYRDLTPSQKVEMLAQAKAIVAKPTPKTEKWTKIGNNRSGHPLYEDENGVRSYVERGIRLTEPVMIVPGRGATFDPESRGSDYRLPSELPPSAPKPKSTADIFDDVMAEEFPAKPVRDQKAIDDEVTIRSLRQTAERRKLRPEEAAELAALEGEKSARTAAKSAVKNVAMGLDEVASGLTKLFGGNKLGSGPSFDEDTYRQALPYFKAGVAHFREAAADVTDMVRALIRHLTKAGMDQGAIQKMKPYVVRFIDDIKDGKESLDVVDEPEVHVPASDARSEPEDVSPAEGERDAGPQSEGSSDRGRADVSQPSGNESGPADDGGQARVRGDRPRRDPAVSGRRRDDAGAGGDDRAARRSADGLSGLNHRIEPGTLDEARSFRIKAQDNIRAIELSRQIESEGRPATAAEQRDLAKYVGWGGIKGAFPDADGNFAKGFEEIGAKLKDLLSPEEYTTARRSIQYAHYTAETVVRAMWTAAERLGFKGGQVFEPGMGVGNFAGMMPADVAASTGYVGLELDHVTAGIAKLLYPKWGVRREDFTKAALPADTFDLVIGNPPFADVVIKSDRKYAKLNLFLHDYFFAKSLDAVRPGGVLMFISSAGTMNKLDPTAREYLADRADLVGAIRLPGNAFKENAGTEVTTDIVILRKRLPGEVAGDRSWTETTDVTLPGPDGQPVTGAMSRYFAEHPEMVLGEQGFFDKLYQGRYAVRAAKDADITADLAKAVERLPASVMADWTTDKASTIASDFTPTERKDGSFYLDEKGNLLQVNAGAGEPVRQRGKGVEGGRTAAEIERIKGLIPIRDALRAVYAADLADDADAGKKARSSLNKSYDAFVRKFGPINKAEYQYRRPTSIQEEVARAEAREESRYAGVPFDEGTFDPSDMIARGASTSAVARARKEVREAEQAAGRPWDEGSFDPADMQDIVIEKQPNLEPFMDDQESYRLAAIEDYNEATGAASKRAVFTENILKKERVADIKSVHDGVLHVLNQKGRLDLGEVASLTGKTETQVIEELGERIFKLPGSDAWVTSDEYLSGNVRKKLAQAKAAASRDPDYQRNVTALEAAQPVPLGPSQIHATLGMPWIPADTISAFGRDALGLDTLNVKYVPALAQWFATGDTTSAAAVTTWGTERMRAPVLISNALNRQNPKVFDTIRTADGKTTTELNVAATQAAQDKMEAIKQRFSEWIWNDPERTDKLAAIYNENYNNLVIRDYDGSYLTTPGVSSHWKWRPHQTRVVARIIQSGNTYMAHAVGAGKTSAMICAGMEMRRLGLVRKPMYAVPNHMLAQFTKEFYEQYPLAKIAVADERRFHTDRRKQFIANVALDDLDAVVITHSAFGKVPISDEFQDGIIKKELDDYRELLSQIPKGQENRVTRSRVEKQIERLEQRLSGRAAGGKKDQVFTFEEMGVDFLFVDEAHLFRKLDFSTKMGTVKGVSPEGSAMSWDLYVKSLYLDSQKPNRSLVLASGTPITNTMAELFTVSRYLQRGELAERGLSQFDAWAGAYGETSAELEQDAAGGYKSVSRFSKFVNVPELSSMVRLTMDVITSKQLEQYVVRPKLKGGKRIMNLAEKSGELEAYQAGLAARMKAIEQRKGPPKKGDDIMLSVINDGRHAAIDMRLVGEAASNQPSKLDLLVDNVFKTWERTKAQPLHKAKDGRYEAKPSDHGPATQMIFANLGLSGARGFVVPNYIRSELVARGVPKSEIAFIQDFKTHVAKQKLFNDMNEGKVRVLIGSTAKMATGVNAQRRLYAIHNLDPLWYPADDEQRNGRALRQGNMNPEIEINDYSTKGTYDSTMWGMMSRKARFIEGFFNGDATMRDMEDLGEASQYEQAKALTTNDPRLIRLTEMKQQLELARRRESSFKQELYALRARRAQALNDAKAAASRIEDIKQDIAQRKDTAGDKFEGAVGGQTFAKRTEFGEAALARIAELKTKDSVGRQIKVGEIGGFPIYAEVRKFMDDLRVDVFIRTNGNHEWAIKDSYSAVGITRSMEAVLGYFETALRNKQADVERSQKFLADSLEASKKEFDGQAAINKLADEVKELEAELTPKEPVKDEGPKRDEVPPAQSVQRLTGKAEAKQREIAFAIRMALNQVAGWDIASRAEIVNRITGEWHADWGTVPDDTIIAGMFDYGQDLVTVALAGNPDAVKTAYHEGWHSIEKVLTQRETDLLNREADRLRDFIARYGDYDRQYLGGVADKEVFAEAAAIYARLRSGHQSPNGIHIGVRRAFEKLLELFARLRNALSGMGFNSAEDIFATFNRGDLASRVARAEYGVTDAAQQAIRSRRGGGSFEPPHETVRSALNDPSLSGRARLSAALDALMVTPSRALWDRLIDLARFQRAAELAGGQRTRENLDTYLAASLYPGRAGERLRDASHQLFRPLYDAMKAHKISRADLHDYLYARHAAERNAQIREIDPNNDAGSGMTDQEAADILDSFMDRQADFDAVADLADAIVRHNRDLMEREGLESRSTLERWEMAYQHYVPLKGAEASETDQGTPALGKGYDVRRPETRRALGRFDRADDILTNLLDQTQRTIIRAEKNRVGKTFLRWAQQNPSPLYRVGLAEQRRGINPNTGLVETIWVTTSADRESVFGVKIAGETYYIDIRHEGLLTALKQIGVDRLPPFMRMISAFTRQYSAFQTARNPEFVLTNLMRDLADASLNLNAETQAGFRRAFVKNLLNGRALMAAVLGQLDRTDNNLGALYNEWRLAGGKISTFGYKDIDTIRKDVEQELERRTESMAKKIAAQPLRIVNPFTGHVVKLFEAMADVTESMTRLAVYAAAREAGLTQAMAAKAARSITVDFNAKGKYGPQIQALYAFANPAMQGTVNLVRRLARSKRMRYAAGSVAMFGFMMTLWNLGASGEDDEKKTGYEKRPYYEREKNFLIFIPGRKDAVKIPMGYALQPFFMMGENAAMMMMGKTKPLEALTNWLGTTAKAFNPIGGEGSIFAWHFWAGAIAPTITDPIFDLTRNRNWLGRPIHPDEMPWTRGSPRSEQSKTTTSPIAVDVAEWLNRVSGGNHFQKGALDVYPDDLEYAWNFALGGYGKFMLNNYNMSLDKIEGIETPVEKTPFVRRFIASGGSQQIEAQQYYDASKKSTDDVGAMRDALQGMKRGRYPEDAEKTIDELAPKVGYHKGPRGGDRMQSEQIFKESTKQLKALREQERELRRDPNVSRADRARLIEEGRKQQIEIMRDARKAYREMQPTP